MNSIHFSHAPLNHHDQLPCTSPTPALSIPLSPDTRAQKVSPNSTIPTESASKVKLLYVLIISKMSLKIPGTNNFIKNSCGTDHDFSQL